MSQGQMVHGQMSPGQLFKMDLEKYVPWMGSVCTQNYFSMFPKLCKVFIPPKLINNHTVYPN